MYMRRFHGTTMKEQLTRACCYLLWLAVILVDESAYASSSGGQGAYKTTHVLMRPNSLNRRGSIGPGRVCPDGEYAIGFKMKVQALSQHKDNTGLNAIRLICNGGSEVVSSEGPAGTWTEAGDINEHTTYYSRCQSKNDYIIGVKLKTEQWLGWDEDDLGAINFEAVCRSGTRLLHRNVRNWVRNRGVWSPEKRCPPEAPAVCGIKSRIDSDLLEHETPDAKGDKAGLTEVQLKCCSVQQDKLRPRGRRADHVQP